MPKPKLPYLGVIATEPLLAAVEEYRFARRLLSRSEAVRRLLLAGLEAEAGQPRGAPRARPKPKRSPEP